MVDLGGTLPLNFWWPCYEGSHINSEESYCDNASPPKPFLEIDQFFGGYIIGGEIYRKSGSKYEGFYICMIFHYPDNTSSFLAVNLDTREIYRFSNENESLSRIMYGFVQNNDGEMFGLLDYYFSRIARGSDTGLYKLVFSE